MSTKAEPMWLAEEVAEFLASCPGREELLAYHPSADAQARLKQLLARNKKGELSRDEQWELNQFEYVEILLQMVKARLRTPKPTRR